MRAVVLLALVCIGCVALVSGVAVGRPVALHNKLAHRRAQLGESQATGELERLRVVASERDGVSLADQFASDVEAHAVAKDALKAAAKADSEATAGLDVAADAEAEATAEAAAEQAVAVDMDVAQAVEATAEAEEAGAADQSLSVEALQELEFSQAADADAAKEKDSKKKKSAKTAGAKKDSKKSKAKAKSVKGKGKGKGDKKKSAAKAAAPAASVKAVAPKTTTLADGTKWSNCLAAGAKDAKGAGQTKLSAVTFKAAPPLREQSYVIEIDGTYTGPDVTYGSVTMQIARVKTHPQEVELNPAAPELVYRHSVVLKDVLMYNPFTSKNPLSATMYVPEAAFNRYAPAGDYALTVVFTNQDKQPFACTKVEFSLA